MYIYLYASYSLSVIYASYFFIHLYAFCLYLSSYLYTLMYLCICLFKPCYLSMYLQFDPCSRSFCSLLLVIAGVQFIEKSCCKELVENLNLNSRNELKMGETRNNSCNAGGLRYQTHRKPDKQTNKKPCRHKDGQRHTIQLAERKVGNDRKTFGYFKQKKKTH